MSIKRLSIYLAVFFFAAISATSALAERTPWGYGPNDGPENWGSLTEKFSLCKDGKIQSPINIDTERVKELKLKELDFDYKSSSAVRMINTGHTVKIVHNEPSLLKYADGSGESDLFQFHFHSPSEHTVDGRRYEMEMHLIHRNRTGDISIVGVFIEEGEYNPEFDLMWDFLPKEIGDEDIFRSYNPVNLLPENKDYYKYTGSITTPPCIENVAWFILKEPIELSAEQIETFRVVHDHNVRPLQSLNSRTVRSTGIFTDDEDMGGSGNAQADDPFEDTFDENFENTFEDDLIEDDSFEDTQD